MAPQPTWKPHDTFANIAAAAKHYGVRIGEQSWKELMHEQRP